ncbi:hypothetical protein [Enterococcus timonensis]|uniref:hypothetical protein n=1 Tax=Enterococcus timonensis TaxID=1852364 RepID=UPI0008D8FCDA|nr:hypothetical protein [Enterococcus timonensis]
MHQVLINIIVEAIIEQYRSEEYFYQEILGVDHASWQQFKAGTKALSEEKMQQVKNLFSDYEWMLVQKIIRQTIIFPERRNFAVAEYRRLKTTIAKHWLNNGGVAELISKKTEDPLGKNSKGYIDLKVSLNYDQWGFDDILSFRLPAQIQQQLDGATVSLLAWVNENLTDTYLHLEKFDDQHEVNPNFESQSENQSENQNEDQARV